MRNLLGRLRRSGSRSLVEQLATLTSVGDGSTLTLDFTTGVLDPRLTFTRGSNATFINSSGLVQWAASNHAPRTNWNFTSPTGSGWNAATINGTGTFQWVGNGTVIASSGSSGGAFTIVTSPTGIAEGLRYVMSVTAQSVTGSPTIQSIFDFTGASGNTYFKNGATATAGTTVASGDRISVSAVATATTMNVRMGCGAWFANRTNESVTLTQFHWHPGSSPVPYYENTATSPRYDSARFDYDPTTLAPRGLLIEGTATNYLPFSQGLAGTGWFTGGICTKTQNYATGPDGVANSATRLEMSYSGGEGRTYYQSSYTTLPHTNSVWLKSNTGSNQTVRLWNTSGTPVTCTVTPTWQRFQSVNTTGTSLPGYFYLENPSSTVAVDILAWGAMLEQGSGASSYIPTGASTVQRLADSAVMNDIAPLNYSATNGSIYWSGIINKQPTSYITLVGFMTAIDQPAYETFGNALNYFTAARGATLNIGGSNEVSRPYVLGSLIKYASSVNTLQDPIVAVNLNGSAGSTNKAGTGDLRVATRFVIGRQPSNTYGAEYPSVTIRSIKYWPTSKVAAELAALTA